MSKEEEVNAGGEKEVEESNYLRLAWSSFNEAIEELEDLLSARYPIRASVAFETQDTGPTNRRLEWGRHKDAWCLLIVEPKKGDLIVEPKKGEEVNKRPIGHAPSSERLQAIELLPALLVELERVRAQIAFATEEATRKVHIAIEAVRKMDKSSP